MLRSPLLVALSGLVLWSVLMLAGCARQPSATPSSAAESGPTLEEWKRTRDQELRRSDGWLTLVGLHWLEEGEQSLGSGPENDLRMAAAAPPRLGVLRRAGSTAELQVEPGVEVLSQGERVERMRLESDLTGAPTILNTGSLSFYLIERGEQLAIRVKDSASPLLASFSGMTYFDEDPAWRIAARYQPLSSPKEVEVPTITGMVSTETVYGQVVLEIAGETYRLEPTGEPSEELFLVFGDRTNGTETYGGGRFLEIAPPREGTVVVDFNRAYNPPCVFTPYATCPLPVPQNQLPMAVPAGEKMFGTAH